METDAQTPVTSSDPGSGGVPPPARTRLERLCAKNPTSILFARLADLCLHAGDVERAIEVCRRGLRYRPSYLTGHLVLAACYRRLGQLDGARDEYRKVLQLDPDSIAGLLGLADVETALGRPEVADSCRERACVLDPLHARFARRDREPAGDSADETPAIPSDIVSDASDEGEALEAQVPGTNGQNRTDGPPFATMTLARLYAEQGHVARAIDILQHILADEPSHADAGAMLEELKQGTG